MEENRNTHEVTTKPSKSFAEIANLVLDWIKKNKVATIAMAIALVMTVGFIISLAIPRNTNLVSIESEIIPTVHGAVPELNFDQLVANLENAGYEITHYEEEMLKGQTHNIYAVNQETGDFIHLAVYENAELALASYKYEMVEDIYEVIDARYYVEVLEKELELYGNNYTPEEIETLENRIQKWRDFIEQYENSYSHGCVNGVVWTGTQKAAEDSKSK